jgi:hypothetical protein
MTKPLVTFLVYYGILTTLRIDVVASFDIMNVFEKKAPTTIQSKQRFLEGLDDPTGMNDATKTRTDLVKDMTLENPTISPGSTKSFSSFAAGTWRIVYAPHISTMGKLAQVRFDPVLYMLEPSGEMTSHARYDFPVIGSGWLSVSGTYSSQDEDRYCRVDFDKAWVTLNDDDDEDDKNGQPYKDLDSVPSSIAKDVINTLGKFFFIDSVSVFPVSYLDNDTIVFDFELLGTRIVARKISESYQ